MSLPTPRAHTGTPGFSRGLVASLLAHGVRLPLVLGHASVHHPVLPLAIYSTSLVRIRILDDVRADGRTEDIGQRVAVGAGRAIGAVNRDGRAAHLVGVGVMSGFVGCREFLVAGVANSLFEVAPIRGVDGASQRAWRFTLRQECSLLSPPSPSQLHSHSALEHPLPHLQARVALNNIITDPSMASPPYSGGGARSPPTGLSLALPRQRPPNLALPTGVQSRKPSLASTTAPSSGHPLRQASFPPAEDLAKQHELAENEALAQYSPSAEGSLDDFSDDNDIRSAISGPTGDGGSSRKRKRGDGKKGRGKVGRPAGRGGSVVNGDDARSSKRGGTAGAPSVVTAGDDGDAEPEDNDEEEDGDEAAGGPGGGRAPLYDGGQLSKAEQVEENARRHAFYETAPRSHSARYDSFQRAKLRTQDVRRLVNQTLGQSVPQNVTTVVGSYVKMFTGMLIESARDVQTEWEAVEETRADGAPNRALKRLKKSLASAEEKMETSQQADGEAAVNANGQVAVNGIKAEPTSPETQTTLHDTAPTETTDADEIEPLAPGGAGGLIKDVPECDRGPLLPDHLREALRRYKQKRAGGPIGFTGLSLDGRENTASRMGGRRLFR